MCVCVCVCVCVSVCARPQTRACTRVCAVATFQGPMTDENVVAGAWGTKETSIKVIHYTGTRVCVCICVCVCVYIIHRLPSPIRGRKRRKHQKEKERVRPRLRGGVRRAGKSSVLLLTRYSGCIPARTIRTPRTRHCAGLSVGGHWWGKEAGGVGGTRLGVVGAEEALR